MGELALNGKPQFAFRPPQAQASKLEPSETVITLPSALEWRRGSGLPPHIGEMATLNGGLNKAGPYVVFMKWHPG